MDGNGHSSDEELRQLIVQSSINQAPAPRSRLPWLTPQAAQQAQNQWDQQLRVQAWGDGFMDLGGGFSMTQQVPLQYVDPLFDPILIVFPQDNVRELNRRLRHYYKFEPYIRST